MGVVWEIIGWLGTGLVVLSMAQQRITRLRILNLAGAAILTVYNLILGVWPMVALNAALSVIQLYHLNLLVRGLQGPLFIYLGKGYFLNPQLFQFRCIFFNGREELFHGLISSVSSHTVFMSLCWCQDF